MKLYTIHCPRCKVLEMKLKQKNVDYTEITDIEEMKSKGIDKVPLLELDDGQILDFTEAVKFINEV